ALTTGTGRKHYEAVVETLSRHQLGAVSSELRKHGLNVWREEQFVAPDGEKITPDLIIRDNNSDAETVIVYYKNALAATAVLEVTNRLKEYNKGIKQVQRYLGFFSSYPRLLSRLGMPSRFSSRGLLLFRVPMPLPIQAGGSVKVDRWFSVRRRLERKTNVSAVDLLPGQETTPLIQYSVMNQDVRISEWTYRRSVFFAPDGETSGTM